MNNIAEQHAGCIWVSMFIAIGIHVLWRLAVKIKNSLGRRTPQDMAEYVFDLEQAGTDAVRADLYAAQCRAALAEKIGKVPADFDPTLLYACQIAAGVHRAAIIEAERQGVIRSGTYEHLYGRSIDEASYDPIDPVDHDGERGERVHEGPVVLDEVRRRRERREERALARRDVRRDALDAFDPFSETPRAEAKKERPAVPCGWSDGRLVPIGRSRRASA